MSASLDHLRQMQADFAAALLDPERPIPMAILATSGLRAEKRFGVYRNNVYASLVETVRARYPVIARLAGEDFFAFIARAFIAAHPPRSPVLLEYGGTFAAFLETFEPVASYPYMADVARLEWLRARAYHAADAAPIDPAALASLAPERVADVVLSLHASAGLLASPYPVVAIWETNTRDDEVRTIGADAAGQDVLVVRRGLEVIVVEMGPGGLRFTDALARGASLGEAATEAADVPGFSLPHAFAALIEAQAIVGLDAGCEPHAGRRSLFHQPTNTSEPA